MIADDRLLYDLLACALALVLLGWFVVALVRWSERHHPDLNLGAPLAAAVASRLIVAGLFAGVPVLKPLRGPDEGGFEELSEQLTHDPTALGDLPQAIVGNLHIFYMAAQKLIFGETTDYVLRVGHIVLAVAAVAVIAIAVTDLAGNRAGRLAAWMLALEPSSVFFSGILHKEAPILLGEALVVLGAIRMYQRRDPGSVAVMILGLGISLSTRPYVGAALAAACACVTLHAGLRRLGADGSRAPGLVAAVGLIAVIAVLAAPSPGAIFSRIQTSQNANTTDTSNLQLPPVDFSAPGPAATNVMDRVSAVLLQPYPWQVANTSQRLGVFGTLGAWALLVLMLILTALRYRQALRSIPPMLYVLGSLTIAYALSTGNAGTGFRYRTHLLAILIAWIATLAWRTDAGSPSATVPDGEAASTPTSRRDGVFSGAHRGWVHGRLGRRPSR